MRAAIKIKPQPELLLHYNAALNESLQILSWNRAELISQLRRLQKTNPYLRELRTDWLNFQPQAASLKEELYLQLHTLRHPYDEKACRLLIESLNNRGLLDESLSDLAETFQLSMSMLEQQLEILQQLEPAGVAARSSRECLILQLQRRGESKAVSFLTQCESEILTHDWKAAAVKLHCSEAEILNYYRQLQACTPFPWADYELETVTWILPEFEVRVEDHHCILESIQEPDLQLEKSASPELRKKLSEARFFLDAVNRRNLTLSLIMNELLRIQESSLMDHTSMHVCEKKMIAKRIGIHPSTLTRAVKDKYFLFQGKLLPIENLFASRSIQDYSQEELIALIHKAIEKEEPDYPLSDIQIAMRLEDENIRLSRQLITKLRKAANIPSSYQRRKAKQ